MAKTYKDSEFETRSDFSFERNGKKKQMSTSKREILDIYKDEDEEFELIFLLLANELYQTDKMKKELWIMIVQAESNKYDIDPQALNDFIEWTAAGIKEDMEEIF